MTRCSLIAIGCAAAALAQTALTPEQKRLNLESFEFIWSAVRDQHWDKNFGGVDWNAARDELRPKIERASTMTGARAIMREMIGRLGKSHFELIPSDAYGDLETTQAGDGTAGLDIRVLDGRATVTESAEEGVRTGWQIHSINGAELAATLRRVTELYRNSTTRELYLTRSVLAKLAGAAGTTVHVTFLDAGNRRVERDIVRTQPEGTPSHFGYLPTTYVWLKSRKLEGNIGYVRFNFFLDPAKIMQAFGDAVQSCMACDGFIIDVRGNPGGIGVMAMGMAGWFVDKPDQRLGTMYMRQGPLKFIVNPRVKTYRGPLAILVDGASGSTSEVLAGGMKDLGRARVFGTQTAGAALPSVIDRLPNGDAFQHALADYISEGGRSLEGVGVIPDVEVKLTREALLAGRDPVLEAAIEWVKSAHH